MQWETLLVSPAAERADTSEEKSQSREHGGGGLECAMVDDGRDMVAGACSGGNKHRRIWRKVAARLVPAAQATRQVSQRLNMLGKPHPA